MVTTRWKSVGASVRGPGHARACMPNQDSFKIVQNIYGNTVVVSDGVGSRSTSHYGSYAACRAVANAARNWMQMNGSTDELIEQIHANWISGIKPFNPENCSATCLFAICPMEGPIVLGMLGDGLIGVLKKDGSYLELNEDKTNSFSNQTIALSEKNTIRQWKTALIGQEECVAILLCTDGISDDLIPEKRNGFIEHIYHQVQKISLITAARNLRKMMEKWPVPKHSDDKTLVFLYKCRE